MMQDSTNKNRKEIESSNKEESSNVRKEGNDQKIMKFPSLCE